ncbi:MAG: response regulator, partial [SAR324 cluster bacterium]|nr:response regulator [SAR324 cluster bacterium]
MKKIHSIGNKILLVVIGVFLLMSFAIILLANFQLKDIVDSSRRTIFEERLNAILRNLDRRVVRLEATQMRLAYEEDFKSSALRDLRQTYYESSELQTYPFIINDKGIILMHPVLPRNDTSLQSASYIRKILQTKNGELNFKDSTENKWSIFKTFDEWNWIVGFIMPQEEKYADVNIFRNRMLSTLIVLGGGMTIAIIMIINKIVQPVIVLTRASKAMEEGDLTQKIDINNKDELGSLARSFSNMRNTIRQKMLDQQNRMYRVKKQQDAVVAIVTSKLMSSRDYLLLVQQITEISTRAIDVDRGSIWMFNEDRTKLHCTDLFEKDSGSHFHGMEFLASDYPRYFTALDEGLTIKAVDAGKDSSISELAEAYLIPNNITSTLNTVIHIASRSVGVVCFEHIGTIKNWYEDEIAFSANIAEQAAQAFANYQLFKARESLQETELRSQAKSEFLANMSHELRTPLNSVLGFSEILAGQINDPSHRNYISAIQTSGKTLLNLINDILDISKIEAGRLELAHSPVRLTPFLKEMRTVLSHKIDEKGLDFKIEIEKDVPEVLLLDETRLRQALINLLGNAFKFTEQGEVVLSVTSNMSANGERNLIISVRDTGIGISEDQLEKIFEAFEQQKGQDINKYGGTGLGLTITKKIIQAMGGSISVKSQQGVGSTFQIVLNNVQVSSVKETAEVVESLLDFESIQFAECAVLLAEDVTLNRELIKSYLNYREMRLIEAQNGEECLKMAEKEHPDLILMDMKMPIMDGFTASRKLKSDPVLSSIPIIALTASALKEDVDQIKQVCDGYLQKPVSRKKLMTEMIKHLEHTVEPSLVPPSVDSEKTPPFSFETLDEATAARLPELM